MKKSEYVKKLEEEYPDFRIRSMIPTYIFPSISLILLTTFLIVFFANKDNFNFLVYFLSFMVPALIFMILGFFFMFLRFRSINRLDKEKPIIDREFKEKIESLS